MHPGWSSHPQSCSIKGILIWHLFACQTSANSMPVLRRSTLSPPALEFAKGLTVLVGASFCKQFSLSYKMLSRLLLWRSHVEEMQGGHLLLALNDGRESDAVASSKRTTHFEVHVSLYMRTFLIDFDRFANKLRRKKCHHVCDILLCSGKHLMPLVPGTRVSPDMTRRCAQLCN